MAAHILKTHETGSANKWTREGETLWKINDVDFISEGIGYFSRARDRMRVKRTLCFF